MQKDNMQNKKKIALITGGTSGMGACVAKMFLEEGHTVISISRNTERAEEMKKELPGLICEIGEVTDEEFMLATAKKLEEQFGKLDILVNSAGAIRAGGIEKLTLEDWDVVFRVNVKGIVVVTKCLLPLLKASGDASVVNISSISSNMTGRSIAYSSSKAAVDMITKSLALELAKYNTRVNSVNPGMIDTGFQVRTGMVKQEEYQAFLDEIAKDYPIGRVGKPEDVANLIDFLCSDKATWISGSNYIIDGAREVND